MGINNLHKAGLHLLGVSSIEIEIISKVADDKTLNEEEKKAFQGMLTKYSEKKLKPIFKYMEIIFDSL